MGILGHELNVVVFFFFQAPEKPPSSTPSHPPEWPLLSHVHAAMEDLVTSVAVIRNTMANPIGDGSGLDAARI